MVAISRRGLRQAGGFQGVTLEGRSVVGFYHAWKTYAQVIPLAEAIDHTRALGFDVSLTSLYDDAVADGWGPDEMRTTIARAVQEIDGPELATAIQVLLLAVEVMRHPA